MSTEKIMEEWAAVLSDAAVPEDLAGTLCVEISGAGGGVWSFRILDERIAFKKELATADSTISMSDTTLAELAKGKSPQLAFLRGEIAVRGDARLPLALFPIWQRYLARVAN